MASGHRLGVLAKKFMNIFYLGFSDPNLEMDFDIFSKDQLLSRLLVKIFLTILFGGGLMVLAPLLTDSLQLYSAGQIFFFMSPFFLLLVFHGVLWLFARGTRAKQARGLFARHYRQYELVSIAFFLLFVITHCIVTLTYPSLSWDLLIFSQFSTIWVRLIRFRYLFPLVAVASLGYIGVAFQCTPLLAHLKIANAALHFTVYLTLCLRNEALCRRMFLEMRHAVTLIRMRDAFVARVMPHHVCLFQPYGYAKGQMLNHRALPHASVMCLHLHNYHQGSPREKMLGAEQIFVRAAKLCRELHLGDAQYYGDVLVTVVEEPTEFVGPRLQAFLQLRTSLLGPHASAEGPDPGALGLLVGMGMAVGPVTSSPGALTVEWRGQAVVDALHMACEAAPAEVLLSGAAYRAAQTAAIPLPASASLGPALSLGSAGTPSASARTSSTGARTILLHATQDHGDLADEPPLGAPPSSPCSSPDGDPASPVALPHLSPPVSAVSGLTEWSLDSSLASDATDLMPDLPPTPAQALVRRLGIPPLAVQALPEPLALDMGRVVMKKGRLVSVDSLSPRDQAIVAKLLKNWNAQYGHVRTRDRCSPPERGRSRPCEAAPAPASCADKNACPATAPAHSHNHCPRREQQQQHPCCPAQPRPCLPLSPDPAVAAQRYGAPPACRMACGSRSNPEFPVVGALCRHQVARVPVPLVPVGLPMAIQIGTATAARVVVPPGSRPITIAMPIPITVPAPLLGVTVQVPAPPPPVLRKPVMIPAVMPPAVLPPQMMMYRMPILPASLAPLPAPPPAMLCLGAAAPFDPLSPSISRTSTPHSMATLLPAVHPNSRPSSASTSSGTPPVSPHPPGALARAHAPPASPSWSPFARIGVPGEPIDLAPFLRPGGLTVAPAAPSDHCLLQAYWWADPESPALCTRWPVVAPRVRFMREEAALFAGQQVPTDAYSPGAPSVVITLEGQGQAMLRWGLPIFMMIMLAAMPPSMSAPIPPTPLSGFVFLAFRPFGLASSNFLGPPIIHFPPGCLPPPLFRCLLGLLLSFLMVSLMVPVAMFAPSLATARAVLAALPLHLPPLAPAGGPSLSPSPSPSPTGADLGAFVVALELATLSTNVLMVLFPFRLRGLVALCVVATGLFLLGGLLISAEHVLPLCCLAGALLADDAPAKDPACPIDPLGSPALTCLDAGASVASLRQRAHLQLRQATRHHLATARAALRQLVLPLASLEALAADPDPTGLSLYFQGPAPFLVGRLWMDQEAPVDAAVFAATAQMVFAGFEVITTGQDGLEMIDWLPAASSVGGQPGEDSGTDCSLPVSSCGGMMPARTGRCRPGERPRPGRAAGHPVRGCLPGGLQPAVPLPQASARLLCTLAATFSTFRPSHLPFHALAASPIAQAVSWDELAWAHLRSRLLLECWGPAAAVAHRLSAVVLPPSPSGVAHCTPARLVVTRSLVDHLTLERLDSGPDPAPAAAQVPPRSPGDAWAKEVAAGRERMSHGAAAGRYETHGMDSLLEMVGVLETVRMLPLGEIDLGVGVVDTVEVVRL
ncbi:hypothetical protein PAPYR_8481 [Paratrimastix pyriformis]|uniref:Uncharacterized protein n=1 Tax=Paratrimastix pyriformis TaxID=342808 RepID=A0ABQ8UFY1_9EUKA|nr:hypothetical protein PAPYR_8481 [Paratrimastix pyriformis]